MIFKGSISKWKLKWVAICIVVCLPCVFCRIKHSGMSNKLTDCYRRFSNVTLDRVVGRFLSWHCEASLTIRKDGLRMTPSQRSFVTGLAERINPKGPHRRKRQAERCVRKEYRMMSMEERNNFHRAVNALKKNTIVEPNVYDALAMLHSEMQIFKAHGGPCFLGWHRVYLLMFEMALRDEVPGVCVPYWDSSLDNELEDPSQSYFFSPELMGNGHGPITTGPFAGWRRPVDTIIPNSRPSPVIRNVGTDGQLYSRQSVEMILSRSDHAEIIAPNSDPDYDIEVQHGGVHMFIGGDMETLVTSPFDPIFFVHHAFVDYIWEMFRAKLRNQLHIDPGTNYPMDHLIEFHGRDDRMDIANFTCGDGYSDELMASVMYEESPSCTKMRPTCNSPFFRCVVDTGRCVPITLSDRSFTPAPGPVIPMPPPVTPRPNPFIPPSPPMSPPQPSPFNQVPDTFTPLEDAFAPPPMDPCMNLEREHHVKPYQNTYCLNGKCDINQWVFVPVKVITTRAPGLPKYPSYPVVNGDIFSDNGDIYQPNAYERTRLIMEQRGRTPRGYSHCHEQAIGQIFVHSLGLNYEGVYKESALIDQRMATTMSIAYIAVKDPGRKGITRALFRASDSCGRICHTTCKNRRTGRYEPCTGVLEFDARRPLMYSRNYGDATLDVWNYGGEGDMNPTFNDNNFYFTFYCDYKDHLPWVQQMTAPPPRFPMFRPRPAFVQTQECRVSPTCVIDVPCYSASLQCRFFGETHLCRNSCGRYAVCHYGHYTEKYCIGNTVFDEKLHRCSTRPCGGDSGLPSNWSPRNRYMWNLSKRVGNVRIRTF